MRFSLVLAAATLFTWAVPNASQAVSLDQACATFAGKLSAAQAAGDTQKAQAIYQQGSQRIASRFNGATCPNVKPPTP
jgi:predicted negative regulator of RcsB-dependent stress response